MVHFLFTTKDTEFDLSGGIKEHVINSTADLKNSIAIIETLTVKFTEHHSPTLTSLHIRHSSFSNPYIASPTPQLILQPFCRFTYFTAHSPTLTSLHLRHCSFFNPSVASPTSQLILQPLHRFTYATAYSSTLLSLHLCHSSFYNPYIASPTSQLILQPLRHMHFTYVTWRAAYEQTYLFLVPWL